MIYSNACSYAIRAMTQLALVRPDGYVLLDELCQDDKLPRHFIAKIFQDLVRHGLLISAKGRGGGFALSRPPNKITLYDIVEAIDGTQHLKECVVGLSKCDEQQLCPQHDEFKGIRTRIHSFLEKTTLNRMSKTLKHKLDITGKKIRMPKSKSKPKHMTRPR